MVDEVRSYLVGRPAMSDPKRRAVKFLEKEIRTYKALSLFFSKKGIKEHVRFGEKKVLISPTFYEGRIKEATKIIQDLGNTN